MPHLTPIQVYPGYIFISVFFETTRFYDVAFKKYQKWNKIGFTSALLKIESSLGARRV